MEKKSEKELISKKEWQTPELTELSSSQSALCMSGAMDMDACMPGGTPF